MPPARHCATSLVVAHGQSRDTAAGTRAPAVIVASVAIAVLAAIGTLTGQTRQAAPSRAGLAGDATITSTYSDLLKRTERRLHLVPSSTDLTGPPPVTLDLWVEFEGRTPKRSPSAIQVHARSDLRLYPTRLRQAVLVFRTGEVDIDLTAGGRTFQLDSPCGPLADPPCAFDGIRGSIDGVEFLRLAHAASIGGTALGFEFVLDAAQRARLREFSRMLDPQ